MAVYVIGGYSISLPPVLSSVHTYSPLHHPSHRPWVYPLGVSQTSSQSAPALFDSLTLHTPFPVLVSLLEFRRLNCYLPNFPHIAHTSPFIFVLDIVNVSICVHLGCVLLRCSALVEVRTGETVWYCGTYIRWILYRRRYVVVQQTNKVNLLENVK